jgi:hypothetical protein
MNNLSIVVDYDNYAVLCIARTPATAAYVSAGILNTYSTDIPTDLPAVWERIKKRCDIYKDPLQINRGKDEEGKTIYLQVLPEKLRTEEWKKKSELAKLRARHIYFQESYYRLYLTRCVVTPSNRGLMSTVYSELANSNDDEENYSVGIKEYAEILEITPKEAYDEIKLMADGLSITNMKYFAWYRKNVAKINTLHTEEEMTEFSVSQWAHLLEASSL